MWKKWIKGSVKGENGSVGTAGLTSLLFLSFLFAAGGCGRRETAYSLDRLQTAETFAVTETAGGPATETADEPAEERTAAAVPIYIHVCGAVQAPGVVELPAGSRAEAAVAAAGGMSPEADPDYVNLAAALTDGEKLYIPTREETAGWKESAFGGEEDGADGGLVNLNTADAALLQTLPGIGESKAADIIAYRNANGAFASPEEIMKVPGIKENAFQKIKDLITVR